MRRRAPRPRLELVAPGNGPADTATVVVGTDGSSTSWDAFCWACGEARRLGGRAIAVFISPAGGVGMAATAVAADFAAISYPEMDLATTEQAKALLAEMLHEAADLSLTFIRATGDPVAELLRIAEEVHADLIVVGRSTRTRHRVTGSVGQRLVARHRELVIVVVPLRLEATCSRLPSIEDGRRL